MNRNLKTFIVAILVALTGLLGACGDNISKAEAIRMAGEAKQAEAAKADAKLMTAKAEISKFAIETARQGGYSATANCNVLPLGVDKLSAFQNFRSSAPGDYREACIKEVTVMNQERSRNYANKKAEERRVAAAKKAKAEQLARAKAAKQAEAKRLAAKPAKPAIRSAAKVANQR